MGLMGARSARFILFCQLTLTHTNFYRIGPPPGFAALRPAAQQTFVSCTLSSIERTPVHRNERLP